MTTITEPQIEQTTWRLAPERSSVEFKACGLWGLAPVAGRFTRYQGTLTLSASPSVERHPHLRFACERATLERERLTVRGRLHARGASVPLELDAALRRVGDELEVEASTAVDHRALGMTWSPLGMIRTPTTVTVKGRLVR